MMRIPSYFLNQPHRILFSKDHIDYLDNQSGLSLENNGWSLKISNKKNAAIPIFAVVFGSKEAKNLQIKIAKGLHVRMDLYYLLDPEQPAAALSIRLGEEASLDLTHVFLANKTVDFTLDRNIELKAKSAMTLSTGFVFSGKVKMRDDFRLLGENSTFSADLLAIAGETDRFNAVQTIRHQKPYTTSKITNLLVAAGAAQMHVDVTGHIEKGMEKSSCHQTNRGIILEEFGVISVEPKLLIDEYDVDAGHGCAIGQINSEELYYLLSRGLTEAEAKELIISGYLSPLYKKIGNLGFLKRFAKQIEQKMKGVHA
jgi:Fe-S cluster assembly protein SufD